MAFNAEYTHVRSRPVGRCLEWVKIGLRVGDKVIGRVSGGSEACSEAVPHSIIPLTLQPDLNHIFGVNY